MSFSKLLCTIVSVEWRWLKFDAWFVCKANQTHLVYGQGSKSKLGNPLWMLFMPKVAYFFVRFIMWEGFQLQVKKLDVVSRHNFWFELSMLFLIQLNMNIYLTTLSTINYSVQIFSHMGKLQYHQPISRWHPKGMALIVQLHLSQHQGG